MAVEIHINESAADYYVEAYTVECVNDKLKKVRTCLRCYL